MNRYQGMTNAELLEESAKLKAAIDELSDAMMESNRRSDAWRERYEALLARTPSKY
jgi:hypothetical protein